MKPIRKVAVAAVAYAITYALRRLGVDLGSDAVNELAQGLVTVGAAYAVRDPRVRSIEEHLALRELGALVAAANKPRW